MSSPSGVPLIAVQAIQEKRYADAIPHLEAFCRHSPASAKDHFQAQVWLVKAYKSTGQLDRAIALCQEMYQSPHPKIRGWAEQTLTKLGVQTGFDASGHPGIAPEPEPEPAPEPEPSYPPLSPDEAAAILAEGNKALKQGRYTVAIEKLEAFCHGAEPSFKDYEQAQTWLAKAYKNDGQLDKAIALCQKLVNSQKPFIKIWAEQYLQAIAPNHPPAAEPTPANTPTPSAAASPGFVRSQNQAKPQASPESIPKAGRSKRQGVPLSMKGVASNLVFASGVTLTLMFGMVLTTTLSLLLIHGQEDPTTGLISAVFITVIVSLAIFLFSPVMMDLIQNWLYRTRWVSLSEVERQSPESARIIRRICQDKKITPPRLGIIDDQNPTAFTYGSFPNTARLVVSQGLFTYLDDDEVATVYAHELGHIVHWDFAVMTVASTLVQICYLFYTYTREIADKLGDSEVAKKVKGGIQGTVIMAYIFYVVGEYLLLYLSRTREYYADHFAAEVTGNPNGLSRALVKIAYGICEEGQRAEKPNKVLHGTRAMGIADPRSSAMTGTAYRVADEPEKVGRVFLWDMFNPWAWWMELNSTHPLTGKRVRALTNYAEQLGLDTEFDMAHVVREGRNLNKRKLYGNFMLDLLLYWAEWILGVGGLTIGIMLVATASVQSLAVPLSLALFGFSIGVLIKTFVMYPSLHRAPAMDVLLLMSDPYASPLRGKPVKLEGRVIGRGDSGYQFGSDLKMQDETGLIYLHYASRFGPIGNFLFGWTQAQSFVNREVGVTGWFRRGIMPWVDMSMMTCPERWNVSSHHRFWSLLLGIGTLLLAFFLPVLMQS